MSSSGKFIRAVLLTGLVAGILDLTIGVLGYYVMVNGHLPENISIYIRNVLRYISSAAFGKGEGNLNTMELAGFFFHFFIAISFTWFYFLIYPSIRLFHKSTLASTIIYGLFVWAIMNMVVVPLSALHTASIPPDMKKALYQAIVLMVCIALPVTLGAKKYYRY
jgi:uncharacterized membrane protein YagU involved in acid resistance